MGCKTTVAALGETELKFYMVSNSHGHRFVGGIIKRFQIDGLCITKKKKRIVVVVVVVIVGSCFSFHTAHGCKVAVYYSMLSLVRWTGLPRRTRGTYINPLSKIVAVATTAELNEGAAVLGSLGVICNLSKVHKRILSLFIGADLCLLWKKEKSLFERRVGFARWVIPPLKDLSVGSSSSSRVSTRS